jgi:predicted helicase
MLSIGIVGGDPRCSGRDNHPAGEQLAGWHLGYETVEPWPLDGLPDAGADPKSLRVVKMRFAGNRRAQDRSAVVDRYQVKTDSASGIVNDPNTWSEDPHYIANLVARIVRISIETVAVVDSLPVLGI